MRVWKPATGVDLVSLEDRLPPSKKVVAAWLPDRGACYMIVDSRRKPNFKRKPPIIY